MSMTKQALIDSIHDDLQATGTRSASTRSTQSWNASAASQPPS
ncbi:hypothetical protein P4118_04015 [Pseudomonas aeruginosa]|nr:hypothetical protein [Pseudomonas aeruginosa]